MKRLFVFLHGIGDCIMFTPALRFYKEKNPNDKVFVLTLDFTRDIFRNNPYIDGVIVSKKFSRVPNFANYFKYIPNERKMLMNEIASIKKRYEIDEIDVILPHSISLFGIKLSIPGKLRRLPLFYRLEKHEIIKLCREIGVSGGKDWPSDFKQEIFLSKDDLYKAKQTIKRLKVKHPFSIIHADASSDNKSLSKDETDKLIETLKDKGFDVLLLNSTSERKDVKKFESKSISLSSGIIQMCSLFVGIDSGPAHIAEALEKRLIVISKAFRVENLFINRKKSLLLNGFDLDKIVTYLEK